jgi:hypothetical protein
MYLLLFVVFIATTNIHGPPEANNTKLLGISLILKVHNEHHIVFPLVWTTLFLCNNIISLQCIVLNIRNHLGTRPPGASPHTKFLVCLNSCFTSLLYVAVDEGLSVVDSIPLMLKVRVHN